MLIKYLQDGEAGGITQQIGASFFPNETLVERMGSLHASKNINVKVPCHAWSNFRERCSGILAGDFPLMLYH